MHRVLNFFPGERHLDIQLQLSMNLRAIISQRLVRDVNGKRAAAVEILRDTSFVRELIKTGEVDKIVDGMRRCEAGGCVTFDQALLNLYAKGASASMRPLRMQIIQTICASASKHGPGRRVSD